MSSGSMGYGTNEMMCNRPYGSHICNGESILSNATRDEFDKIAEIVGKYGFEIYGDVSVFDGSNNRIRARNLFEKWGLTNLSVLIVINSNPANQSLYTYAPRLNEVDNHLSFVDSDDIDKALMLRVEVIALILTKDMGHPIVSNTTSNENNSNSTDCVKLLCLFSNHKSMGKNAFYVSLAIIGSILFLAIVFYCAVTKCAITKYAVICSRCRRNNGFVMIDEETLSSRSGESYDSYDSYDFTDSRFNNVWAGDGMMKLDDFNASSSDSSSDSFGKWHAVNLYGY